MSNLETCIEYLGHVEQDGPIRPSPKKIKAVPNFAELKNTRMVQNYSGLAGYMRKFIEGST